MPEIQQSQSSAAASAAFVKQTTAGADSLYRGFNPERRIVSRPGAVGGLQVDPAIGGPHYIFFTSPDLNLDDPRAKAYLGVGTPTAPTELSSMLTAGSGGKGNGFIYLLTNSALSAPHQDVVLDTFDVGENWAGKRMTVPKDTGHSRQSGSFQVPFQERAGAPVSRLLKLWVEYIEGVSKGYFRPKSNPNYMALKVLDFAVSAYSFQLAPDGFTVLWATRYVGVFPTAIPGSSFEGRVGDGGSLITPTAPFSFSYMEVMDPWMFSDFNQVMSGLGEDPPSLTSFLSAAKTASGALKTYGGSGAVDVGPAGVATVLNTKRNQYELHFAPYEGQTSPLERI